MRLPNIVNTLRHRVKAKSGGKEDSIGKAFVLLTSLPTGHSIRLKQWLTTSALLSRRTR